jgi:hypothetical protein
MEYAKAECERGWSLVAEAVLRAVSRWYNEGEILSGPAVKIILPVK